MKSIINRYYKPLLIVIDLIAAVLGFVSAYYIRNVGPFRVFLDGVQPINIYLQVLPVAIFLLLLIFSIYRLYDRSKQDSRFKETYKAINALLIWLLVVMALSYLSKYDYSRIIVILFGFFTFAYVILGRLLFRYWVHLKRKKDLAFTNFLIVGYNKPARKLVQQIQQQSTEGFKFCGFIETDATKPLRDNCIAYISDLHDIFSKQIINEVIICDPCMSRNDTLNLISRCKDPNLKFRIAANLFEQAMGLVDLSDYDTIPTLDLKKVDPGTGYRTIKRGMDILISSSGLLIASPLLLIIVILIHLDSKGKAIFVQKRVGYKGKEFLMYKFRTMYQDVAGYAMAPTSNSDLRITKFGKYLRRSSLDELPQLVNVLKGEMSFVGPRPEMPFIVASYQDWQKKRLLAKPGITGLWQILGRKDMPLHYNIEYDFYYINNQSIVLDLVIIFKTIPSVIFGKGAY